VLFYGRFVTKCFGSNISLGLFFGGCGLPVMSTFVVCGFCSGASPNGTLMFNVCGIYVGGILVVGALWVGGVDFALSYCTVMRVYSCHWMGNSVLRDRPVPWGVV
jgi:hypothetical protein